MQVVILAGGLGTRLGDLTTSLPKPMVEIGGKPIIEHIIHHYRKYGFNDFLIAAGYKQEKIKSYFYNYNLLNSDFTIQLSSNNIIYHTENKLDVNITVVDTGYDTLTGGRLLRLSEFITSDTFMVTYGDGLSDVNLNDLLNFHNAHTGIATCTAVRPPARFGELQISNQRVESFTEKPNLNRGWINGGFFVFDKAVLELIDGDKTMLEREPMERLVVKQSLFAYQHDSFWQCMDTKRDLELLQRLYETGKAPWI